MKCLYAPGQLVAFMQGTPGRCGQGYVRGFQRGSDDTPLVVFIETTRRSWTGEEDDAYPVIGVVDEIFRGTATSSIVPLEKKRKPDTQWELYDLKQKKVRRNSSLVPFPRFEPEDIGDYPAVTASLAREELNINDDAKPSDYFDCSVCDCRLRVANRVGRCSGCGHDLGLCCLYDSQWGDRLMSDEPPPEKKENTRYLCPACVEAVSYEFSSGYESSSSLSNEEEI